MKTETDFNLSDKLHKFEGWHSAENRFIHINHIKEFIKRLKEGIEDIGEELNSYNINDCIDKLAGEKLVKTK